METTGQNAHAVSLQWFNNEYFDSNGSYIEVLDTPPTPLEFSRIAHISRPVVIKGVTVPANESLWSDQYLLSKMGERLISVAVTPNGHADAVTRGDDGRLYFVEPHVQKMTLRDLFANLSGNEGASGSSKNSEICYLQSQNGNVYSSRFFEDGAASDPSEFESLRADIPSEVSWCSEAFGRPPDAVNLWIGDSKSVTSTHSDPYENIYTVVRGAKHFTLLPPTEGRCLKERTYPHALYTRPSATSPLKLTPSAPDVSPIRWSSISEPDLPGRLPLDAHPLHITLQAGETLYLPAGWWHHVRQSQDTTIALNWWYDIEMRGMSWVLLSFLRGVEDVPPGNVDEDGLKDS